MLCTQFSIVLTSAVSQAQYFWCSSLYLLSDAREESLYHHHCWISECELLCLTASFCSVWLLIIRKWCKLKRKTCQYNNQKELLKDNIQFLKINSLICIFMFACLLWRVQNCCNIKSLLLFERSFFKILTSDSSHFVFSIHVYIDEIECSREQMQLSIFNLQSLSLTVRRILSVSICIWINT